MSNRPLFGFVFILPFVGWMVGFSPQSQAIEPLRFRAVVINDQSEFCAAAVIDVNGDGRLDIVSGGWWYEAPKWNRHRLRDVEKIGTRFDDYSNLLLDVDKDNDQDIISVNYRSKSIYWVRNPGPAGGEWERVLIDTPGASETGRLVDVDQDGHLDILPNGTTFSAWYSLAPKSSTDDKMPKWDKHDLPSELAGHGIGAGDINGDGRTDLVSPNGWAEAPVDRKNDRWLWHPDYKLPRDCSVPIVCHDVDGDGDEDLIWGRGHNVGVYWTEQITGGQLANSQAEAGDGIDAPHLSPETRSALSGTSRWVTHAIDTSWSCMHAPLLEDLDGDGQLELIAGKRYQGHEGKDPGEDDPLVVFSFQFDKRSRTWQQRTISRQASCGLDLDPKCIDIDADGDLDIVAPSRGGLTLLENLRLSNSADPIEPQHLANAEAPLPSSIDHDDFSSLSTGLELGNRHRQIQRQMELVMGTLPTAERRSPLAIKIVAIDESDKYTRIKLTYVPEPGDRVPAYLLVPHDLAGPAPAMLCLHPTHFELGKAQLLGLGGKVSRFYAHELAERGFVCLVPDYPGFGDYKYDFANQGRDYDSGTMKAIWNNIRGLDLLESLPCVQRDSIGAIGHSLGGHNSLFTAAFDVRVRAVVTSCGFNAFEDYYGGNLKGWSSDRYMPRIESQYANNPNRMPFDFPEVLAAIAPRPLFVNAPLSDANFAVVGVRTCQAAVEPIYKMAGKSESLTFAYPDAEHDFPDAIREQAYAWLTKQLGK